VCIFHLEEKVPDVLTDERKAFGIVVVKKISRWGKNKSTYCTL
jgi:hypothetical protein